MPPATSATARRLPSSWRPRATSPMPAPTWPPSAGGPRARPPGRIGFASHGIDLVLEPTLPIVPYGRGPGYERGSPAGPGDPLIALTALWDMTGMPVAALPVTWQAGVSLVAPRGREAGLLQAAIDLQEHALGVPQWSPTATTG